MSGWEDPREGRGALLWGAAGCFLLAAVVVLVLSLSGCCRTPRPELGPAREAPTVGLVLEAPL